MQDRRLATCGILFAAAAEFPVAGTRKVELPARDPGKPKRTAVVALRHGEVEICRPPQEQDRSLPKTVRLRVVEAREVDPPPDVEPLDWRLLTTHGIPDAAGGVADHRLVPASLGHRAIVPGDESPGASTGRQPDGHGGTVVKLAAVAVKAACIDIQSTQKRDGKYQLPGATVFTELEMDTIEALVPTLEGSTDRQKNPCVFEFCQSADAGG
jgi:hypothetical protein